MPHLRSLGREMTSTNIRAAICIDQTNLGERSQHVSLMNEIYNQSAGNLVYLGEPDHSTSSAFHCIGLIMEEIEQEFSSFADFKSAFLPDYRSLEHLSQSGFQCSLDLSALETFFDRPIFR